MSTSTGPSLLAIDRPKPNHFSNLNATLNYSSNKDSFNFDSKSSAYSSEAQRESVYHSNYATKHTIGIGPSHQNIRTSSGLH